MKASTEAEMDEEFNIVSDWIGNNCTQFGNVHKRCKKRHNTESNKASLWENSWGRMLNDPRLQNPLSAVVSLMFRIFYHFRCDCYF